MKFLLEELFKKENEKFNSISSNDINGKRLVESINRYITDQKEKILSSKDPNLILNKLVVLIDNLPSKINELNFEINATRREAYSKLVGIKISHQTLAAYEEEQEKISTAEEESKKKKKERIEDLKNKIESGKDPEKARRPIGTRPDKISEIRQAKTELEESKNIT